MDNFNTIKVSDEKSFIYHESFNRGHIQVPSMVSSCIGLSNNAKSVYGYISRHVFEKGQTAFPSVYRIAFACNCTVKSVINYIDELVEKGFIVREHNGKGRNNSYMLVDLVEIPLLKVSEMFWEVAHSLQSQYSWRAILVAKEKIVKAIEDSCYDLKEMEVSNVSKNMLYREFLNVLEGGEVDMGFLPRNRKLITTETSVNQVDEKKETSPKNKPKISKKDSIGVSKNHYKMKDVKDWKAAQFRDYFYDKYLDVLEHPHPRSIKKHTGMLNRVYKLLDGDSEMMKTYIDAFFEIGYDNKTLENFSSSTRIGEIQTYLNSGKKPFYLERNVNIPTEPRNENTSVYKGMSRRRFNELFGGDN